MEVHVAQIRHDETCQNYLTRVFLTTPDIFKHIFSLVTARLCNFLQCVNLPYTFYKLQLFA